MRLALLALCALASVLGSPVVVPSKLRAAGSRLVDAAGRQVLLHGTSLDFNFQAPEIAPEQIAAFVSLGFNFVRLGFHWHLYEVAPGQFNESYISAVEDVADRLGAAGMYVLLDMHQDNWSPLYCGGHGIPAFYGYPTDDASFWVGGNRAYPFPLAKPVYPADGLCVPSPSNASASFCAVSDCANVSATFLGWASTYATDALGSAAQRLYSNEGGARDAFARFWMRVAQRFGSKPFVVGYGLINEPWLGDIYADVELLVPGVSDRKNLQPLYAALADALGTEDPSTLVWFEPATGGNILDALPAGFTAPPLQNQSVLGYHVYCPPLQSDLPHPGENQSLLWLELEACMVMNAAQFDVRQGDWERLGVPGVLTEFGSVDDMPQTRALLTWTMDQMDQRLASWAYWLLTPSMNASQPNWEDPLLRRAYPHAVVGELSLVNWTEPELHMQWTLPPSLPVVENRSYVFVPNASFTGGIAFSFQPAEWFMASYDPTTSFLSFSLTSVAQAGGQGKLLVAPKG
jgi:hypothetical protein